MGIVRWVVVVALVKQTWPHNLIILGGPNDNQRRLLVLLLVLDQGNREMGGRNGFGET